MSEEEKKALKYLRKNVIVRIDIDENGKEKIAGYGNSYKYILLKLIKRQQKEIESLQKEIKEYKIHEDLTFKCLDKTKYMSNYISKDKIKKVIKKYYNDYEEQKNYRYTLDVEDEQSVLKDIEKELLEE